MSFIKKTIKKTWKFVKKNWKMIVIAAAIVFTAGIATIGFAAFAAASGTVGGFFGAVGTTMWAGVAGIAGTMGIGSGAVVPTSTATIAAGTAGTNVGLGAAWGAGGGAGWGAGAGSKIAAANAKTALEASAAEAFAAGETAALANGATAAEAAEAGMTAQMAHVNTVMGTASQSTQVGTTLINAAGGGMSDAAWKAAGVIVPAVGAGLAAAGQEEKYQFTPYYGLDKEGKSSGYKPPEMEQIAQQPTEQRTPAGMAGDEAYDMPVGLMNRPTPEPHAPVSGVPGQTMRTYAEMVEDAMRPRGLMYG